jgi:hypothetical protein
VLVSLFGKNWNKNHLDVLAVGVPMELSILDGDVDYFDVFKRLVFFVALGGSNLRHNVHAFDNTAKDSVLVVQPGLRERKMEKGGKKGCKENKWQDPSSGH